MKILAFDTATMETTCALVEDEKVVAEASVNSKASHSEGLIAMIQHMLDSADWAMEDVDLIATGVGPGSFTGLRISVVLAKVFGHTLNVPVVGVSTLKALAREVATEGVVIPLFDARRERVYAGVFEKKGEELVRLKKDDAYPVSSILEEAPEGAILIGDGLKKYREAFSAREDFILYPDHLSRVSAAAIAFEGAQQFEAEGPSNPYALEPNYLRPTQAMREYRRKHGESLDARSDS
ncbi:tRNA (adenosine(37)-N6)-threonylcarbamoyltransferase complex dimerization subunit type 1 TsaB [Peptoniphilus sp. EMRHCC_23]|uniref:tRNA (adenosine(37)-N6)-threonylcarbamoyltransferase complex dimerization subunit type 1 TsaB n=1 Tax=Peptoniphilus rachelemmaiella TaxID=2811779 RepID=UPI001BFFF598|nr:tRNA (adenosine(37)-N6)-threonylcarbamoyltransferase complex dimerization subunit type 1 TsaB [Peptoniphilus rachelemmaiella]